MELTTVETTEISLRLLNSGRYVWTITSQFKTSDTEDAVKTLKRVDNRMRDEFPDHATRGTGRVASIDEND